MQVTDSSAFVIVCACVRCSAKLWFYVTVLSFYTCVYYGPSETELAMLELMDVEQ